MSDAVVRLKITLEDTDPPIWRRIEVKATTTLKALHPIIQAVLLGMSIFMMVKASHDEAYPLPLVVQQSAHLALFFTSSPSRVPVHVCPIRTITPPAPPIPIPPITMRSLGATPPLRPSAEAGI